MPRSIEKAALAARTLMQLLAVAWLVSLVIDAAHGRVSWILVLVGGLLVTGWLGWSLQPLILKGGTAGAMPQLAALCWQEPSQQGLERAAEGLPMNRPGWTDSDGQPVRLKMVFDLGPLCLIRLVHSARPRETLFRWIDAETLNGPWRWRLMVASSALSSPEIKPLPYSSHRSAGRLA